MSDIQKKIVTIGGGSGQYVLLSGLRDLDGIDIKAVVSMVDSGGSTGRLRDELGVLPPGDILKCVLALSPHREVARDILQARFNGHERLRGHSAGNMLLTMLSQYAGCFADGVEALGEILGIKGRVLPVTTDRATLVAELTDGTRLYGEAAIDVPRGDQREKIKNVYLVPHHGDAINVHSPVTEAIAEADYLIIGPGDLYTSIVPNFLVPGVKEAIENAKGEIIYIPNIMTKFGETHGFSLYDFISYIEQYTGQKVGHVIYNKKVPPDEILKNYEEQKAYFVECEPEEALKLRNIIKEDLLDTAGKIIRHDPVKLAGSIERILRQGEF
jgi:uncharacterized cofD-like protein